MKFRHELSYDAPPDKVYAMLASPATQAHLDHGLSARNPLIRHEEH
jgi:hypothetical protein